ncbi:TPA: glycosyltransferase [Elizabethkingia anophelis]
MSIKKLIRSYKKDLKLKKSYLKIETDLYTIDDLINKIEFKEEKDPKVTIIIPVHNQLRYTLNCLYSIMAAEDNIPIEILIINDKSTDNSLEVLSKIPGLQILNNSEKLGFLRSANKGINEARGEFVYLLNNHTKVLNGYLSSLLNVFELHKDAGAVGSKLIYADGKLQGAGFLLFENEMIVNRGASQSVHDPRFNFLRKVDYCSGSSLIFRKKDVTEGFNLLDPVFSSAYYGETDLCMRFVENQKLTIYYQPQSEIIHYENVNCQQKSENKQELLKKNHRIFWDRWGRYVTSEQIIVRGNKEYFNDNKGYSETVLVVEEYLPKYDQDSGANRFTEIIKILVNKSCKVYLLVKNLNAESDATYIKFFEQMGVEVLRDFLTSKKKILRVKKQMEGIMPLVDFIWIFRPEGFEYYEKEIKSMNSGSKVIYDTVDLHYLRFDREKDFFSKSAKQLKKEDNVTFLERKAIKDADAVIAISDIEKRTIAGTGIPDERIFIVSNIHIIKENLFHETFENREGLVFIGGFLHKPNVDAVKYLYDEIMPLVWKSNNDTKVYIIGGNVPDELQILHSDKFQILGYQKNIDDYFTKSKAFVAPLRYGAGVKGKIGQALEYKLPVISTTIGVEGMKLQPDETALVVDIKDPVAFAKNVLLLDKDKEKWNHLHNNSEKGLAYFSVQKQKDSIIKMFKYLTD